MNITFKINEEKSYELRLTTRGIVKLEQAIGKNLISMFLENGKERIPTVGECVMVLYYALQPSVKNMDEVYDIYDEYVDNGGSNVEFISIIVDLFKECGVIPKDNEEEEGKN